MKTDITESAMQARYDVPEELVMPGMSVPVRKDVAVLSHENCKVFRVSQFADKPYRSCGAVSLLTLEDFKAFVQGRSDVPGPSVFVTRQDVVAYFNMDGWRDDTASFALERTPEWKSWKEGDGRSMRQDAFCDFLEDHQKEIVSPRGAELLEMVANFRQLTRVEYGSSYRGADGQVMLEYKERKEGAGGRELALPAEFVLHLPVIRGAEEMTTYELRARLRVRVDEDSKRLTLQYQLVRPDIPEDNAVTDIVEHLRGALPEADVFAGSITKVPMTILS